MILVMDNVINQFSQYVEITFKCFYIGEITAPSDNGPTKTQRNYF